MSSADQSPPEQQVLALMWRDLKRIPTVASSFVERRLSDD